MAGDGGDFAAVFRFLIEAKAIPSLSGRRHLSISPEPENFFRPDLSSFALLPRLIHLQKKLLSR
jgi:hypothetical protein